MRTSKPISTISFNSVSFLTLKLKELKEAGRLSFWCFVQHLPEDDEGGKKEHCHVYIEPSKMLQTDDLKKELLEPDPSNPDKPLGCLSFYSSKFGPWYLYGLHDNRYLSSIGQSRRYYYSYDDFVSSDPDDFLCKCRSIDMLSLSPYADMEEAQKQGLTFAEYFARGTIPLPQLLMFQKAWDLLMDTRTERGAYSPHASDFSLDQKN